MQADAAGDGYLSLEHCSGGLYKEKGSRFLAFARPAGDEEEVKQILEEYKKEYFDARHHCYAYRLGPLGERWRAFDDGEPAHSAGDPILGQLRARQLTQALVVVVRYFGGTKLGVPGLVNAYRSAAAAALDANRIVERHVEVAIRLAFPYAELSRVMRWARELELRVEAPEYGDRCRLLLRGRSSVIGRLREMLASQASIEVLP
jgi:uncharacterized YigZ family protein